MPFLFASHDQLVGSKVSFCVCARDVCDVPSREGHPLKNGPETRAAPVPGLYKHAEHSANYEACLRVRLHVLQ